MAVVRIKMYCRDGVRGEMTHELIGRCVKQGYEVPGGSFSV